ncbi:hypothetical protein Tco_0942617 [Tanacetum coccineum]
MVTIVHRKFRLSLIWNHATIKTLMRSYKICNNNVFWVRANKRWKSFTYVSNPIMSIDSHNILHPPPQPQYVPYSSVTRSLCSRILDEFSICYDDDDDKESYIPLKDIIIFGLPPCVAITPVLSTEEPVDSLIMEDKHLDTIPTTELDEVIKSSFENLFPFPKCKESIQLGLLKWLSEPVVGEPLRLSCYEGLQMEMVLYQSPQIHKVKSRFCLLNLLKKFWQEKEKETQGHLFYGSSSIIISKSSQYICGAKKCGGTLREEEEDHALMAFNSNSSSNEVQSCSDECVASYNKLKTIRLDEQRETTVEMPEAENEKKYDGILSYENEVLQSVFMNKESDLENQPLYDRFVTAEGMHDSQPSESETQTSDFDTCESNISVETSEFVTEIVVNEPKVVSQPKVWSDAPIIEEYESDSEDEHVSLPTDLFILWLAKVSTDSAKLIPLGKDSTVIEMLKKVPPRRRLMGIQSFMRLLIFLREAPFIMLSLYITTKEAGKPMSISEASIRSDLLFDDADGIDSLPN